MSHSLDEIMYAILNKLNSPTGELSRELASATVSAMNSVAGVITISASSFISKMDEFMIDRLLLGLSDGINQEKQINDLYNYVTASSKRAFLVGSIFKQTLLSKSPKVCVLYGKILSEHIGDKTSDFSKMEMIACNAISNVDDYDLMNFVIIMKEYVIKDDRGIKRVVFDNINDDKAVYELEQTCSWCTYNRLFSYNPLEWTSWDAGNISIDAHYIVQAPAEILLNWIEEVKQIWEYM